MPVSYTYATLKDAIQDGVEDQSTEFSNELDDLIARGETRLLRDLDFEIFDVTDTVTFTPGTATVTKPTGHLSTRSLFHTVASVRTFLEERSYEYLIDYWPNAATTGTPLYYCELNDTQWLVVPTPPAAVTTGTSRFLKRPTGLSGSTTTTWLSTNAGDCLLHACLIEASKLIVDDERLDRWEKEYMGYVISSQAEFKNLMRKDYKPLAPMPQVKPRTQGE